VVQDPTYYAPYCQTNLLYGSDASGNPTDQVVQVSDNCVQPSFDTEGDCELQVTRIKVIPPGLPADVQIEVEDPAGACSGGSQEYVCDGSGEATGQITVYPGQCSVNQDPGEGNCPPPYVESPDPQNPDQTICIGQGLGGNCMRGYTFNQQLSCCSAEGSSQTSLFGCPPGFDQIGDDCVNTQSGDPPGPVSQSFGPVAYCPPTTGGGGPGGSDDCVTTCSPTWPYTCTCQ
jgi:hypothetical protein